MDPHLAAVRDWDKNYLPTEKEAYQVARIDGYVFPNLGDDGKIGSLYGEELEAIASHPPIIDLTRYKKYRGMTYDQMKAEFPALVNIIGPNTITEEDLFYYATRGWIPEYDNLNMKIDRWSQYNDLSKVGKILMNKLYIDQEGYVDGLGHPLEQYIISFDQNMDNEAAIRSIGERIGISIPPDAYAHDVFFEKLLNHIELNEPYGYERFKREDTLSTEQTINMTEKEYYDYITDQGYKPGPGGDKFYPNQYYSDRLSSISD